MDTSDEYAASVIDRLYGHNDDYTTNDQRCPMWLVNFGDLISYPWIVVVRVTFVARLVTPLTND